MSIARLRKKSAGVVEGPDFFVILLFVALAIIAVILIIPTFSGLLSSNSCDLNTFYNGIGSLIKEAQNIKGNAQENLIVQSCIQYIRFSGTQYCLSQLNAKNVVCNTDADCQPLGTNARCNIPMKKCDLCSDTASDPSGPVSFYFSPNQLNSGTYCVKISEKVIAYPC